MPWLRGGMQNNSEDAVFERSQACSAPGNAEEATRDREDLIPDHNEGAFPLRALKKKGEQICWTINTGGLGGVWRIVNVLKGLNHLKRPRLINLQETSCDAEQWKTVERHFKYLGYKAFPYHGNSGLEAFSWSLEKGHHHGGE